MRKYTRKLRQEIVNDYIAKHGSFNASEFVEFVREAGAEHPAYEWFEWDDEKCADRYRVDQARDFVSGLTVSFSVQTVQRGGVSVRVVESPMLVSPMEGRKSGGGYIEVDPLDPVAMSALAREAASTLQSWLNRYASVLARWGVQQGPFDRAVLALVEPLPVKEIVAPPPAIAARPTVEIHAPA
jgi:hypothetical protein